MRWGVLLVMLLVLIAGCGEQPDVPSGQSGPQVILYGADGPVGVSVEVVSEQAEMQQGLMFRESLPEQDGMLFLFESPHLAGFWMKNTLIPLDIIMIDADWNVQTIHTAVPCEADPCEHYYADTEVQYVLEVNAGFAEKFGIERGTGVAFAAASK